MEYAIIVKIYNLESDLNEETNSIIFKLYV